jgi:phosphate/sulfate permease
VKSALHLLIALVSLAALLAIFVFWMFIPVAAFLLYVIVRYAFERRRRSPVARRDVRLAHEARAREVDSRRSAR